MSNTCNSPSANPCRNKEDRGRRHRLEGGSTTNVRKVAVALTLGLISAHALAGDAQAPSNERTEKFRQKMEQRIQEMDTDGDGAISKAEFLAQAEAKFDRMDANGDGKITPEERQAMREKWRRRRADQFP